MFFRFTLFFLALLIPEISTQQTSAASQGHWVAYGIPDGLGAEDVVSIFQDRNGLMWFGTRGGGVSRFDGHTWKTFTTDDGLANNFVYAIVQDSNGIFWFATSEGVSCFDGKKWKTFTTEDGLVDNGVRAIYQDHKGHLWFGTQGGVGIYDGHTWKSLTTEDGLAHNQVRWIMQDKEDHFWFATYGGGISKYDGENWTTFTTQNGLADNTTYVVVQDQKGDMWFGTRGGASQYDGTEWTTYFSDEGLSNIITNEIFKDRNGVLWFAIYREGIRYYDGKKWGVITSQDGLANDTVYRIIQDRENNFWIGSRGGLNRYDTYSVQTFTQRDGLAAPSVLAITQDMNGHMWAGTEQGISRYDGKSWQTFTEKDGLTNNSISSLAVDSKGNLWVGTFRNGLSCYTGEEFINFTNQNGLPHNRINSLLYDKHNMLWAASFGGVGRFDGQNWETFTQKDGLIQNNTVFIFQDRSGRVWASGNGLSIYNGKTWETLTENDGLPSKSRTFFSIVQDRSGNFWFTTWGFGLIKYDMQNFSTITTQHGLPHNVLWSSLMDRNGRLWFGTVGGGVSSYDGQVFQTITMQDGLVGDDVRAIFEDRDGVLWFGTENGGVTRYSPPMPFPPTMKMDAVVADKRYETPQQVVLTSLIDLVAFEFHGISFKTRPDGMVYRYRLSGYDTDWQTTRKRRVEYNNLPVGSYRFEIQAIDRDMVYSEQSAVVGLNIHYPYERIGWLTFGAIAIALLGWQTTRVIRRDRHLSEANDALSQANHKLFETNRNLQDEISQRERVEQAQQQLDERFQQLQYLYTLRTELTDAKTPSDVVNKSGQTIITILLDTIDCHIEIELDGQTQTFGTQDKYDNTYTRNLFWAEQTRGQLKIACNLPLSEIQEQMLLDETAGQISRKLEALELEMQLLQSSRLVSMGEMAAGVAHELNQPLSALATTVSDIYLRLLDNIDLPTEELKTMMKDSSEFVNRMEEIITHLRVFARDESETPHVQIDLNEIVHSSLRMIGTQLQNRGIILHLNLADALKPVDGHPNQLEQVILNLLANARDAFENVPNQDHQINIQTATNNTHVILQVEDNGAGIDPDHVNHIFEPFFTTKQAEQGTGLGLSISYALVKNHNGEITCESTIDQGTVFKVQLPISALTNG